MILRLILDALPAFCNFRALGHTDFPQRTVDRVRAAAIVEHNGWPECRLLTGDRIRGRLYRLAALQRELFEGQTLVARSLADRLVVGIQVVLPLHSFSSGKTPYRRWPH